MKSMTTAQSTAGRHLSALGAWAIAFGCAVGWGSFVMPGTTFLPKAGPLGTVLGVMIGGAIMSVIAANYHFMIKRKPGPGGAFAYAAEAFGIDHGFLCAWFLMLTYVAIVWANATALTLVARYTLDYQLLRKICIFGFHYEIAGYDIWFGDIVLSCAAILIAATICCRRRSAGVLQSVMAIMFFGGIIASLCAAIHQHTGGLKAMQPLFAPPVEGHAPVPPIAQILRIVAMAPWLFVGFEAISHSSGEFRFKPKKSFGIMAVALATSVVAYSLLAVLPALMPIGDFVGWAEYIGHLADQSGFLALPTFATATRVIGRQGVMIMGVTMACAIFTNLVGNTVTASRLMVALADEKILPAWFGRKNKSGAPQNAILAITAVSLLIPALGRTAIGFIVDVTTIGAAIAYAYTSAATYRLSPGKGGRLARVTGIAGVILSIAVMLTFLLPNLTEDSMMATESFLILVIWCILGLIFFHSVFSRDRSQRFGNSTIVWISMLGIILFMSTMWIRSATQSLARKGFAKVDAIYDDRAAHADHAARSAALSKERKSMVHTILNVGLVYASLNTISIILLFSLYHIHRRREHEMEQEKARAKSYFFSTVSHDIRTPLNAIIGYSHLLKSGFRTEAERTQALDSILMSGKTLLGLVDNVLDLSKLESGRVDIALEPTDCGKLARDVIDALRATNGKTGLELRSRAGDMPLLMLDQQKLQQILFNLVGNAIKFTEKGFVEVRASYSWRRGRESGRFLLEVEDTGIGISEEDRKRLGSAYVQIGSKMSRNGGTGLGLAICKQLAAAMGGKMEIASTLGVGSTFSIEIPDVKPAPAPARPAATAEATASDRPVSQVLQTWRPEEAGRHAGSADPDAPRRILLVDDAKMNLLVLKALINNDGDYEITMAEDGLQALKALEAPDSKPFDLVLTDMWMPNMDGEGLVRSIRGNPGLSSLKVVVVTADVELQSKYAEKGFDSIILKPVSIDKLSSVLPAQR